MLKHLLSTTATIGAVAVATSAFAQSDTRPYCDEGYVVTDTNDDDMISQEELSAARSAEFTDLDADGNGTVSQEEYTSCMGAWAANAVTEPADAEDMAEFDMDGDGEISADEFMGRAEETANMRVEANSAQATSTGDSDATGGMPEEQILVLRRILLVPETYDTPRIYGMSNDEMSARAGQRFEATDTNRDNSLSEDEWASPTEDLEQVRDQLRSRLEEGFASLDNDQSGDISEEEYYSAGVEGWDRANLMAERKGTQSDGVGAPVVYFRYPSTM